MKIMILLCTHILVDKIKTDNKNHKYLNLQIKCIYACMCVSQLINDE